MKAFEKDKDVRSLEIWRKVRMDFLESVLEEAKRLEEKNNIDYLLKKIQEANSIVIWGTGLAGNMIYSALTKMGYKVDFFADGNVEKQGQMIDGKRIVGPAQIPQKALVIIAANVKYNIHKLLINQGIEYIYMDPIFLYFWNPEIKTEKILKKNRKEIDMVYELLSDAHSKKVFKNVLIHRLVHDLKLIWEVYEPNQYFGNCTVQKARGCFVDCGAFQGDTLSSFLKQVGDAPYKYYAFEPDKKNYDILRVYCQNRKLENVHPINLGIWDRKEELFFQSDEVAGSVSGKVKLEQDENVVRIMADSIDNILSSENIDFIKMDIEGAEIKALNGARKSVNRTKPILAISAYHELEHLWQIPLLIKEINADYEIFFNHHMWNMADTVCYAVERK